MTTIKIKSDEKVDVFLHNPKKRTFRFQRNRQPFRELFKPLLSSVLPFYEDHFGFPGTGSRHQNPTTVH
jgi:hypothetical protein